jgi:hypothetical protein
MKKTTLLLIVSLIVLVCSIVSCQKESGNPPNEDLTQLRLAVSALQQRTDSLTNALAITNNRIDSLSKRVDSIRNQLTVVMDSIKSLNTKILDINADITTIKASLASLNQKYLDLLTILNQILAELNSPVTTIKDGLLAYFHFDGNVQDASGNGNNGTVVNSVSYGSNWKGSASSALQLGAGRVTTNLQLMAVQRSDAFSISFWFKDGGNTGAGRLVSNECPEGNFRIASYQNGVYAMQIGGFYVYDTVALNTWTHISYNYSNRNIKIYKNGVLKVQTTDTGTDPLSYCAPFTIGAKASSAYDQWVGSIDELRIYNRVLTDKEVNYLATN